MSARNAPRQQLDVGFDRDEAKSYDLSPAFFDNMESSIVPES
jgi:hypothetical protein